MSDAEIESDIAKEEALLLKKDPFEKAKEKLRKKQENTHEDPDKPYVEIKIPATGEIGKKCVCKINKKVPHIQIAVSQNISWKKRDKYDLKGKPEIVCRAFYIDEIKDANKIEFVWEDIGQLHQEPYNFLQAGEYMVEVRAWSKEAYEETNAKRLVKVK